MTRNCAAFTFMLAFAFTTSAWAQEVAPAAPCYDQTGDELRTCLQEALQAEDAQVVTLPRCEGDDEAALLACNEERKAYQAILAELTQLPCAGFADEELTECQAANPPKKKKKGLSKHEGTKMERMSGTGEEDE